MSQEIQSSDPNIYAARRRKAASVLAQSDLDALLVTNLVNVRYLTGFSGSNAAVILYRDARAEIATDGRYTTQIALEVPDIEALIARPSARALVERLSGELTLGVEAHVLPLAEFENLEKAAAKSLKLVGVQSVVEKIREVKDADELDALREVAQIGNHALATLIDEGSLAAGKTEREVAADLEYLMRTLGSDRESFDTIIASGPNSAKPHHSASDRVIEDGDFVTIDFGAHVNGYNSDMTRTFAVGEPTEKLREIYAVVHKAQLAGIKAARVGAKLVEVDQVVRTIIDDAGYGEYYVHSTGHGIGLDVHEAPFAAQSGTGELAENMTLTIEPGIYLPGVGGVRIEDTLIITAGDPEIITIGSKDLHVV